MADRIFVTGMGICSPIGNSLNEVIAALEQGRSGIEPIRSFDCTELTMRHAGEVKELPNRNAFPKDLFRIWDRGTRMAMHAAGDALRDARVAVEQIKPERIGVCIGTSGSGQYQNARFQLDRSFPIDAELVFYLSRNSPHFQSSQVAAHYGILGPNLAIGAATAGGGIAIATAMSWLRTSRTDMVLVGGSESFSLLNVLGFDQLGLSIPEPCTPFSGRPGMTFGEGAGYLVLETEASANRRTVRKWAEIRGVAIRADGFDPILFDPAGDGQHRAMTRALAASDCLPGEIDWIRASGTGGRDQDLAETQAIKSTFESPPPVSSLEPYLGHANGAGPAIGLVAAILCLEKGLIPATLGCTQPRVGCDLDYVAEGNRKTSLRNVLCNTAAFGGVNTSIVVGVPDRIPTVHVSDTHLDDSDDDEIVMTGIGMVSPLGCGMHELAESFGHHESNRQPFTTDSRMSGTPFESYASGFVQGFSARKHCPLVPLRGIEPLTQYAAGAVALALKDASLEKTTRNPRRVGVVSGIARPSGIVFERLFTELQHNGFRPTVGRLMLRNGRFMIASQLANWFDLKGYTSTISMGIGCGLHSLVAAYDQLRRDPSLDALVVVASDELSPFTMRLMQRAGLLLDHPDDWRLYDGSTSGYVPGEGAAAVVIERNRFANGRGKRGLCVLAGAGITFDGMSGSCSPSQTARPSWEAIEPSGEMLSRSLAVACDQANVEHDSIGLVLSNGTGIANWDQKEMNGLERFFGDLPAHTCVNDHTGLCESSSSLFNLAAAVSAMKGNSLPQRPRVQSQSILAASGVAGGGYINVMSTPAKRSTALVTASTEHGHNAAVVLKRIEGST